MKFGPVPPRAAEGAILVHSLSADKRKLKKGRVLSAADCAALAAAGHEAVVVARLEAGDCREDEAARRVAQAVAAPGLDATAPFTGRVNLVAETAGVLVVDRARVDAINLIDEAVTLATLEPFEVVQPKQLVATIKIIPFAAPEEAVAKAEAAARAAPPIRLAPFAPGRAGLIQTELPGLKPSVLDKTAEILADRLLQVGGELVREDRCAHAVGALRGEIDRHLAAGLSPILIAGASAITDRRDVIPAAIEAAGGTVDHYGMPVDPGNLMLMGHVGAVPVIGLPGCARSPKLNGFDWVLQRLAAGIEVTRADIMRMGAGGLLKEIATRPQPRGEPARPKRGPRIGAILLAAGQSRRMGRANKLTEPLAGRPLAAHILDALLAARIERPVLVVTGHEAARVEAALDGPDRRFVRNPRFEAGLSTSLAAGLSAVPGDWDGVLVALADMPAIDAATLDALIAAFDPVEGRAIVVPTHRGKRGNPVVWARRFFDAMAGLGGDAGAKHLIGEHEDLVAEVETESRAVLVDIDTPDLLAEARAALKS